MKLSPNGTPQPQTNLYMRIISKASGLDPVHRYSRYPTRAVYLCRRLPCPSPLDPPLKSPLSSITSSQPLFCRPQTFSVPQLATASRIRSCLKLRSTSSRRLSRVSHRSRPWYGPGAPNLLSRSVRYLPMRVKIEHGQRQPILSAYPWICSFRVRRVCGLPRPAGKSVLAISLTSQPHKHSQSGQGFKDIRARPIDGHEPTAA